MSLEDSEKKLETGFDKTKKEYDFDYTVKETKQAVSDETIREGGLFKTWHGYSISEEFPAEGGEADIFVISKDNEKRILKLYRKGMESKEIVLSKIKELSEKFSDYVIRIIEFLGSNPPHFNVRIQCRYSVVFVN